MASAVKDAVKNTFSTNSSSDKLDEKTQNYKLRITAGPNYDKSLQRLVVVNGPSITVSDQAKLTVRIKDYSGLPSSSTSHAAYFDRPGHEKDTFSLAFAITPTADIRTKDLYFGLDTGHNPIRKFGLPESLVQTAFKIVREFIDPSLTCDASADEPYVMGPALTSATMEFRIGEQVAESSRGTWDVPSEDMSEGAIGSGKQVRENAGLPDAADKRRKYLMNGAHRDGFLLEKGRTYDFDFSNGYIDWRAYALKLPGFSWSPLKHIGDKSHKVRYVLKDIKTGQVYFVVMCELLAGEQMRQAVEDDRRSSKEGPDGQTGR